MILFPAIDILNNNAVRLLYGSRNDSIIYGNPVDMALKWQNEGAEFLHVVDLNAAFDNDNTNLQTIKEIMKKINIPVQVGGGLRTMEKIDLYLEELGINRIIIGTAAVTNPTLFEKAVKKYGGRIVCGIDSKDDKVAIKGWVQQSDITPLELALKVKAKGVTTVVYTDISRDGALTGVNYQSTLKLQKDSGLNIIASGGVKDIEDVKKLKSLNCYGVILGKALYEKTLDLKSALEVAKGN